ncbi:substrate-binding periplasmic protein [Fluviispira multicolorata]|uniref:Transporter substrate-binding domain-containing protein n=1 Tax=Fluviispira multicolorata TaxID=2654512 RepID=A0A833JFQ9_9BACT|nr:transporter substrate-binding domain-containing protein [Fluviispira multicolorata]KAB8033543.1 transporter substrate-binding domain-containing protein [Fluviispira multicolorata]
MKRILNLMIIIVLTLFSSKLFGKEVNKITLTTEAFIYQTEKLSDNRVGGLAGKIISASLKKINFKYNMLWLPWKRAQLEALLNTDKATFILPLTRNNERESKYNWVSHLYNNDTTFFRLKGKSAINDLKSAKNLKTGVLNGSSYEITLKEAQLSYETSTLDETNVKKLILKKIDAWYTDKLSGMTSFKINNINLEHISYGRTIDSEKIYIATAKSTPQALVKTLRNAIEEFKKSDEYKSLLKDSFKNSEE